MIQLNIDPPDGWKETGEFRSPKNGEAAINLEGEVQIADYDWPEHHPRIILRPVKPKVEQRRLVLFSDCLWRLYPIDERYTYFAGSVILDEIRSVEVDDAKRVVRVLPVAPTPTGESK